MSNEQPDQVSTTDVSRDPISSGPLAYTTADGRAVWVTSDGMMRVGVRPGTRSPDELLHSTPDSREADQTAERPTRRPRDTGIELA